jgi:hypothetical protein
MAQMLAAGTLEARMSPLRSRIAPVGGQLQRAGKAHLALALEKIVAKHLHIGRARASPQSPARSWPR